MPTGGTETLEFSKHEGAGNDFLVVLDPTDVLHLSEAEVRRLCDRRRGVGADGVIRVGPGDGRADLSMELHNADGGLAETSGNGLRCLAQAAVDGALVRGPRFTVLTGAGLATVDYEPSERAATARVNVAMGVVTLVGETVTTAGGHMVQRAETGNPHLVVRCEDPAQLDVATLGAEMAAEYPGGINVEFIAPGPGAGEITMRVFERGAGETRACGSGSCAAAVIARAWGLVEGERVLVRNPGGTLEVALGAEDGDPVVLGGPVRRVARVTVERSVLA
ncbi:MAG: diaminopimelate epimerase [Acidimicrobiales bacterium]